MSSSRSKKPDDLPDYVYYQHVKGHDYFRFRRAGIVKALPQPYKSPQFWDEYARLMREGPAESGRYRSGSVADLIHQYKQSSDWSKLKPSTQRDYERYLNRLDQNIGSRQAKSIDAGYVAALIDELKETRGVANHTLAIMRTLFQWGKSPGRKLVIEDPTAGFEKLAGGDSHRRWPQDQIDKFLACDKVQPAMKVALLLGLATGQRISDVARLCWRNYDGAAFDFVQLKTGTALHIPAHDDIRATLDTYRPAQDNAEAQAKTILLTKTGLPYHDRVISRDFLVARGLAEIDADLTFHGLRHTTGNMLAEAGATAPQIMSILGHKSLQTVMVYIRQAQQKLQAAQGMALLQFAKPTAKPAVSA
jgi:integrase